jgi:hypothetical protein
MDVRGKNAGPRACNRHGLSQPRRCLLLDRLAQPSPEKNQYTMTAAHTKTRTTIRRPKKILRIGEFMPERKIIALSIVH